MTQRAPIGAALVAAFVACGEVPDSLGTSATIVIEPGRWAEAELAMAAGDAVEIEFDSGGVALAWDVHVHGPDGEPVTMLEGLGDGEVIEVSAPETRLFWALWSNATDGPATLDVRFRLYGSAAITGWYP